MSLRDTILAHDDLHKTKVDVSQEWGCELFGRMMTADEYDEWWKQHKEDGKRGRERLLVLCTVDAEGNRVFHLGDEDALAKKGHKAIHKLWLAIAKLNGLLPNEEPSVA